MCVLVGDGGWSGVKGWEVGWGACYRGCCGHSKPGFEIKFKITVFEIKNIEIVTFELGNDKFSCHQLLSKLFLVTRYKLTNDVLAHP